MWTGEDKEYLNELEESYKKIKECCNEEEPPEDEDALVEKAHKTIAKYDNELTPLLEQYLLQTRNLGIPRPAIINSLVKLAASLTFDTFPKDEAEIDFLSNVSFHWIRKQMTHQSVERFLENRTDKEKENMRIIAELRTN